MSTIKQDYINIKSTGSITFNDDNNLTIYSNTTNQLTLAATADAGKLLFTSGTSGIVLDSTYGSSTTGSVAGPINLVSNAASSWKNSNSNLTLETSTSGNILLSSVGAVNVTSNSSSTWSQISSTFTLNAAGLSLNASSGCYITANNSELLLNTTGTGNNLTLITYGASDILATSSAALTLSSVQNSSWTVDTANLTLQTVGASGSLILSSVGATNISSDGILIMNTYSSMALGANATSISIGSSGMTTTIQGDLVVVGTSDTQITAQSEVLTSTDVAAYSAGELTAGALRSSGGIGTTSNILANANGATVGGPVLNITQNSTTAEQPVAFLQQSSSTQSFLSFVGASNNLQPGYSIVRSDASVTFNSEAYIQIQVRDTGETNPLGGGTVATYYLPIYSIE